jgi:hypothetical protein
MKPAVYSSKYNSKKTQCELFLTHSTPKRNTAPPKPHIFQPHKGTTHPLSVKPEAPREAPMASKRNPERKIKMGLLF